MSTRNETQTTQVADNSRRELLQRSGFMAGAAVLASSVPGLLSKAVAQDTMSPTMSPSMPSGAMAVGNMTTANPFGDLANLSSDLDILNFALLLEYLEADFYARVIAANARRSFLQARVGEVAQKLALDEAVHVTAITNAITRLGGTPVAKPMFQFPENTFVSQFGFLELAGSFEVTGIGAYLGAAPKIKSREYLRFAASIYGIEARHTAIIRMLDGRVFAPDALEKPLTTAQVAERVAPFILA